MIVQADARSVLNAFFRHKRLFLLFFIPINLAALIYLMAATPGYESTAKLLVKFGPDARPEVSSGLNGGGAETVDEHHEMVQSNVKILTSRDISEALLNDITLPTAYPKIAKDPPRKGTPMDAAVKKFNADLVVKTDTDSSAINLGLFNSDPAVAATMLRRLLDLFIVRQSEIYSNPQTFVLREQANQAYKKLQEDDKQLNDYKAQARVASIDQELNLLIQQRADIAGYLSRRAAGPAGSTASHASGGGLDVLPGRFPTASGDRFPTLDDVQRKIDDLRSRQAELLQTYKPDSEIMINLRDNLNAEIAAQGLSVRALERQIADLDQQIAGKDRRKAHYEDLMREVQLDEDSYKVSETRAQEAEAGQDLNQRKITQISVIEQPTTAYKASRPRTALVIALCLLAGIAFGLAGCIIVENFDRSFSLPDQAAAELGVPVLANFARYEPNNGQGFAQNRLAWGTK